MRPTILRRLVELYWIRFRFRLLGFKAHAHGVMSGLDELIEWNWSELIA